MQETGNSLPDKLPTGRRPFPMLSSAGRGALAAGRGTIRLMKGLARARGEAAVQLRGVRTWTALFVMLAGGVLMLTGLVLALLLKGRPVLTLAICLGSILIGALLIGFSKIVEAAELYIHRVE